jgi:hypothetical protein
MIEHDQASRILIAQLHGTAMRYAGWEPPDEETTAAAVAGLLEVLAGRDDGPALLAEVAGILIGAHEGALDEAKARIGAGFCRAAGADEAAIQWWTEVGRERARNARPRPLGM